MTKFLSGLVVGVLLSTMFFVYYFKKHLGPTEANVDTVPDAAMQLDEEFVAFYERFHSDSLYQIDHIVFPLEGIPPSGKDAEYPANFRWEKEAWVMHKRFDPSTPDFSQNFVITGENLIFDQIKDKDGLFGMQRRFAKLNGEWTLIYYAAMNQLIEKEE